MAVRSESSPSMFDTAKLVFALVLVVGGIYAFYYFSDQSLLYRVLGLVGIIGLSLATVFTTNLGRNFWGFFQESRTEVRKVVWPSRQETLQATLVVVVMVFIVGLILWLLDMFLLWGVRLLTGQGG